MASTLDSLPFDNLALRKLPVDPETKNSIREVKNACFALVEPAPLENPRLVSASLDALQLFAPKLTKGDVESEQFLRYFSGNAIVPGSRPAAHCYCGHQFGYFSGQLGDGATMYLGEVLNEETKERWEIQFKGAGKTPFSRTADGRKVLRSSIREYLCSEAMHYLGVPTTRAGTIVTSDSRVVRDIYYTGNPIRERCTVILRIAPSFIRFGSFEIFKATDSETGRTGPSVGNVDLLRQLTNYCIETFFPAVAAAHPLSESQEQGEDVARYKEFFKEVVDRTITVAVHWQRVGFCHGVLNTDNMSILGLTIDYGPFGFMEAFDPGYICNGSDKDGRYTYEEQPRMCKWNCGKLAEALQPILPAGESKEILDTYDATFNERYNAMMLRKVGLIHTGEEGDQGLVSELLTVMEKTGADWTGTFSLLTDLSSICDVDAAARQFASLCSSREGLARRLVPSYPPEHLAKLVGLAQSNPAYLEMLGVSPAKVYKDVENLKAMRRLQNTSEEELQKTHVTAWKAWLARYQERLARECASPNASADERRAAMRAANPAFVLRNRFAQQAIDAAEEFDFSLVEELLSDLREPYSTEKAQASRFKADSVPEWAEDLVVT